MTKLQIILPDELATEAKKAGLLTPDALQALLREGLREKAGCAIRELWSNLDDEALTPSLEAEIAEQVRKARASNRRLKPA